ASAPASKYVRIVGRGDQASDPRTLINEVEFFNDDVTQPLPSRLPAHLGVVTVGGLTPTLPLGETVRITYSAKTSTGGAMDPAGLSAAYRSSDTAVLTVSSSGVVTPKAVGSAFIDVTISVNGESVKKTVAVSVTDPTRLRIYANADSYVRGGP